MSQTQTNANPPSNTGTDYIEESKIGAGQQMMSSCAGACLVSLFMTPLDVVKIRLQAQELVFQQKCFLYSNGLMDHLCQRLNGDPPPVALHTREEICNCRWYNRPKYFDGTMDALIKIGRTEGMASLWSGLSPTLVLAIPATVVYFTSYEQLRDALHRNPQYSDLFPQFERSSVISMTAGSAARMFATTLVSPLEMVRTKMQSKKMAFSQVREALALTLRHEGVWGLWKGCGPTLLRDVPFSAMYWPVYEFLRGNFLGTDLKAREKMPQAEVVTGTFVAGALAGSLAATATLPFDVIKTR